ncbi:heavy metal translocating P-type ATPase [Aureimonas sp. SA4125]|uniref:heavy metal translocating P-type ATPase n=1 Tax=Aureimonas sp. SA4125 TaxID=2826993 RepID=UPI001CC3D046|nr:heavy metal translocating P-type ATPase [Aureimonas sp. SA4125]
MMLPIACAVTGLAGGTAAYFLGAPDTASLIWSVGVVPVLAILLWEIVVSLRRGDVGLDLVAALSMTAALLVGETLAAAVVALMYASGQALEAYAAGRASREMNALLDRVPRTATRYSGDTLQTIPISDVAVGDRLLVHLGDVLPVDGTVVGSALLDEAPLTGESLPVTRRDGEAAMSGSTNVGAAFDLLASEPAARSTYAGIVRLVEEATKAQAPMTRLADRYALGFMAATLGLAAFAWWISGDAVRAVAVLVVATPCPLILAVPVAIVAGISRAARVGVLVKGGAALETLGRIRTLVVDKTGTLTHGSAAVSQIVATPGWTEAEILRLAASLDQASQHAVARAVVTAAAERGLVLDLPTETREVPGEGVEGRIAGRLLRVGGKGFVSNAMSDDDRATLMAAVPAGALTVALSVDGAFAGLVLMRDALRADVSGTLARMRTLGVTRIVLATGDRKDVAVAITENLGIDDIAADLGPEDKIALVRREKARAPVMMVGDGVNDAPALVEADLGIAMGAKGAAASAEAADVILLRDSLDGLGEAMAIGQRSRAIALQSVLAGIGLSGIGMVAAALGYLPPVQGALLQEAIDVAVILNALRALRPG